MDMRWIRIDLLAILIAGCDRSPPEPMQRSAAAAGAASPPVRATAIDPPAATGATSPNLVASGDAILARDRRRGPELELAATSVARAGGFPKLELLGEDIVLAWTDTAARTLRALRLARRDVPTVGAEAGP